ncbi:MAG TPA: hypothetical protein PKD00_07010, partial [Burkholderiales bacterium]|nr:hypothetical protein [Burkholderiales bacterium]
NYFAADYADVIKPGFGDLVSSDGTITLDSSSEMLTMQVDNVKDPKAVKLGLTLFTLGLAGYLVNLNIPLSQVIDFLQVPSISKYLSSLDVAESEVIRSVTENKPTLKRKAEALQDLKASSSVKKLIDFDNAGLLYNEKEKDNTAEIHKKLQDAISKLKSKEELTKDDQALLLAYFFDIVEQSKSFTEFIMASSPDTRTNKSLTQATRTRDSLVEFLSQGVKPKLVSEESFLSIYDNTIVSSFYDVQDVYSTLFGSLYLFIENEHFKPLFNKYYKNKLPLGLDKDTLERYDSAFINDLFVTMMFNYIIEHKSQYPVLYEALSKHENKDYAILQPSNLASITLNAGINDMVVMSSEVDDLRYSVEDVKSFPVIRLADRTIPFVTTEDMIRVLSNLGDTELQRLNAVSLLQAGTNNSPYSFEKILPFSKWKEELIKGTVNFYNHQLNTVEFEQFFATYSAYFFRANPFANGTAYAQQIKLKATNNDRNAVSQYVISFDKNGRLNINGRFSANAFRRFYPVNAPKYNLIVTQVKEAVENAVSSQQEQAKINLDELLKDKMVVALTNQEIALLEGDVVGLNNNKSVIGNVKPGPFVKDVVQSLRLDPFDKDELVDYIKSLSNKVNIILNPNDHRFNASDFKDFVATLKNIKGKDIKVIIMKDAIKSDARVQATINDILALTECRV